MVESLYSPCLGFQCIVLVDYRQQFVAVRRKERGVSNDRFWVFVVIRGRTTTLPSWLLSWSLCCFKVGVEVCIVWACLCLWRCLLPVPTLLLRLDTLSIWWSTDIPFPFFDVLQSFRLHILLDLLGGWVEVLYNFLHVFRFQYKVSIVLHETHCGPSIPVGVWADALPAPWLLQFQMVLLISVPSFCDMTSSYVLCPATPFVLV